MRIVKNFFIALVMFLLLLVLLSFSDINNINKKVIYSNIPFNIPVKDFYYYLNLTGYKLKAKKEDIDKLDMKTYVDMDTVRNYFKNYNNKFIINKHIKEKIDEPYYYYGINELKKINFNGIDCYLSITSFSSNSYSDKNPEGKKFKNISYIFNLYRAKDFYPLFYFRIYFDRENNNRISFEIMEVLNNSQINCYIKKYDKNGKEKWTKGIINTDKNNINFSIYSFFDWIKFFNFQKFLDIKKLNFVAYDWKMLNLFFLFKLFVNSFNCEVSVKDEVIKYNSKDYDCYILSIKAGAMGISQTYTFFIDKKTRIVLKVSSTNKYEPTGYFFKIVDKK